MLRHRNIGIKQDAGPSMNRLSLERRTQIVAALVEGNSIRSVERMTNTHRDTIMRLMVRVGEGCGCAALRAL